MFGREGISYFREITQLIQINPITLSLYDPTAKISDHTFLVFYPTIRGEIPLFYYYIIIPLLLFLSSPRYLCGSGWCAEQLCDVAWRRSLCRHRCNLGGRCHYHHVRRGHSVLASRLLHLRKPCSTFSIYHDTFFSGFQVFYFSLVLPPLHPWQPLTDTRPPTSR